MPSPTLDPADVYLDLSVSFDDDLTYLVEHLESSVRAGLTSPTALAASLPDLLLEYEVEPSTVVDALSAPAPAGTTALDLLALALDHLVTRQRAAEATWTGPTDADRLADAFTSLEASGVIARMDFTCCGTCGHYEINGEVTPGTNPAGYTFFHQQATESMAAGHGVHLAFGSFDPDATATTEALIGARVRDALLAAGLTPQWDGTAERTVFVPLLWRKRMPA